MKIHRELSKMLVSNLGDHGLWTSNAIHPVVANDDEGNVKMMIICSRTKNPLADMTADGNGSLSPNVDSDRAGIIQNNFGGMHGMLRSLISKIITGDICKSEGEESDEETINRIKSKYAAKPEYSTEAKIADIKAKYNAKIKVPRSDEQKVADIKDKYKDYLGKSKRYSAHIHHKQPTSEEFLKAASQFLGLPITREEADRLTKADDDSWRNSLNNFYKEAVKPIENRNTHTGDEVRGPIDQHDESQLTEEEQRIRRIPVQNMDHE